jgi:hypothetical protein
MEIYFFLRVKFGVSRLEGLYESEKETLESIKELIQGLLESGGTEHRLNYARLYFNIEFDRQKDIWLINHCSEP